MVARRAGTPRRRGESLVDLIGPESYRLLHLAIVPAGQFFARGDRPRRISVRHKDVIVHLPSEHVAQYCFARETRG